MRFWTKAVLFLILFGGMFFFYQHFVLAQKLDTDNLIERSVSHEGIKRHYYVYAPSGYDPGRPIPCVFVFHRYKQTAKELSSLTEFNTIADKYNFLVVYPSAYKGNWSDGRKLSWLHSYNDIGFVSSLIDTLEHKWNVDRSKIYAAGFGNGGFFAQALALSHPDKIAAVASVAATLPKIVVSKRKPHSPVSVLLIVGDKDPVVPFSGGPIGEGIYRKTRARQHRLRRLLVIGSKATNVSPPIVKEVYLI